MSDVSSPWTPELVNRLRTLWLDEGLTYPQIGARLDQTGQLTAGAVHGKVRRLGLQRKATNGPKPEQPAPNAPKPSPLTRKFEVEPEFLQIAPVPVKLATRKDKRGWRLTELGSCQCRFPLGDPFDRTEFFCGEPTPVNSPWCYEHRRRVFAHG